MRSVDFNRLFQNKKALYMILTALIVGVFSLTIAYAALNAVLRIEGSADIYASSWDIYLDNLQVKGGSVNANPKIVGNNSISFSASLVDPGDFLEFTFDVVNDGSVDGMIAGTVQEPILTERQRQYLRYDVEYVNGSRIDLNQTLKSKSKLKMKVRIEFRKDISISELPKEETILNNFLSLVIIQSDGTGTDVVNGGIGLWVASGDINTPGSLVCIDTECFHVYSNDGTTVKLLAQYNLYVGYNMLTMDSSEPLANPRVRQDSTALGATWKGGTGNGNAVFPRVATIQFSNSSYWHSSEGVKSKYGSSYPANVLDTGSVLYPYVMEYKEFIQNMCSEVTNVRLIHRSELYDLGCTSTSCDAAPEFVQTTSYWTDTAVEGSKIYRVSSGGYVDGAYEYTYMKAFGIRPVIEIPVSAF